MELHNILLQEVRGAETSSFLAVNSNKMDVLGKYGAKKRPPLAA
jgi:hypothetical protein